MFLQGLDSCAESGNTAEVIIVLRRSRCGPDGKRWTRPVVTLQVIYRPFSIHTSWLLHGFQTFSGPKQRFQLALRQTLLFRLHLGWPVQESAKINRGSDVHRSFWNASLITSVAVFFFFSHSFRGTSTPYLRLAFCRRSMWVSWFSMSPCALGLIFKVRKVSLLRFSGMECI